MRVDLKSLFVTGIFATTVAGLVFTAHTSARAPQQTTAPAEFVVTNGKIVTVEDGAPEAQALAASGGKIVAIGTNADIKRLIGPGTEVIDAKGQLVIPGFIEGHGHYNGVGTARLNLNLMNVKNWDEIVAMVAERVKTAKPGEWILAPGEVGQGAAAERRRLPAARVTEQGLAKQPGVPHSRERPRQFREREGDGTLRRDGQDTQSLGR
jgi:hypothetical protein